MTPLGRTLRHLYATSGHTSLTEWCQCVGVSYGTIRHWMRTDTEKAALERRIDELCAEVERLHADQAHWELGNCPSCPNIADLQEALEQNAKLRELVDYMTPLALYAASERERDRMRELGVEL